MKKIDWNHAITRKDYAIHCGLSFGFAVLVYAALVVWACWGRIESWAGKTKDKIRAKFPW